MRKFKVGDRVKVINEAKEPDRHLIGMVGIITGSKEGSYDTCYVDFGKKIKQGYNKVNETTHNFYEGELELTKDKMSNKVKIKPEDLTRYMVYGQGCDNKGKLLETEKELKEDLTKKVHDGSWTGRIIGYKLVPLHEAEKSVKLKTIKPLKKTSKKKKKK